MSTMASIQWSYNSIPRRSSPRSGSMGVRFADSPVVQIPRKMEGACARSSHRNGARDHE